MANLASVLGNPASKTPAIVLEHLLLFCKQLRLLSMLAHWFLTTFTDKHLLDDDHYHKVGAKHTIYTEQGIPYMCWSLALTSAVRRPRNPSCWSWRQWLAVAASPWSSWPPWSSLTPADLPSSLCPCLTSTGPQLRHSLLKVILTEVTLGEVKGDR